MSSRRALALLAMLCLAPTSEAGVTAERTRLVFVEGQREASLLLVNQNPYPVLVQAWVDDGALDGEPDTALAPFLPLPPVFRLEPGRQRSLRLLATGQAQARDRESLYWLNIYEIPASHRRGRWPAPAHGHPANPDEGAVPPARPASARRGRGRRTGLRAARRDPAGGQPDAVLRVPGGAGAGDRGDAPGSAGTLLAPRSQRRLGLPRRVDGGTRGEVAFDWIDDNGVSRQERKALQ